MSSSVYPGGYDPIIIVGAASTLDAANHTNLHNMLSEASAKLQLKLGATPTPVNGGAGIGIKSEGVESVRQRLLNAEVDILKKLPIASVAVTNRSPGTGATATWSGEPNRILTLGIPAGAAGTNGSNGEDGVSLVAASGTTAQQTIKAGAIFGLDVSYGKNLGFVPKVCCTPIQETVGTSAGVTTTHYVESTPPTGSGDTSTSYATYQGDGARRTGEDAKTGMIWHGMYGATNGHQHGIVMLGNLVPTLKNATITKVEVKFHAIDSKSGTLTASDQITVHQSNLTTIPASQLNTAVTGAHYIYKKTLTEGGTFTFQLPSSWHAGFKSGSIASLIFGPERNTDGSISDAQPHYGAIQAKDTRVTVFYTLTTAGSPIEVDSIPVDVGVRKVTQTGFRLIIRNSGAQDEKVKVSWMASA